MTFSDLGPRTSTESYYFFIFFADGHRWAWHARVYPTIRQLKDTFDGPTFQNFNPACARPTPSSILPNEIISSVYNTPFSLLNCFIQWYLLLAFSFLSSYILVYYFLSPFPPPSTDFVSRVQHPMLLWNQATILQMMNPLQLALSSPIFHGGGCQ
jgi:hypothetical protein